MKASSWTSRSSNSFLRNPHFEFHLHSNDHEVCEVDVAQRDQRERRQFGGQTAASCCPHRHHCWCQLSIKRLLPWHEVEECWVFLFFSPSQTLVGTAASRLYFGGGTYQGYCINTDPTHWLANWDAFIICFRVRGCKRRGIMIRLPWPWTRKLNVLRLW